MYKQIIIVRNDLKMKKGKMAAQVAHAAVKNVLKSKKTILEMWDNEGMKKTILKVDNINELLKYKKESEKEGLVTSLIKDAGKTYFNKPTITCLGIGPDKEEKIDKITGNLKLIS